MVRLSWDGEIAQELGKFQGFVLVGSEQKVVYDLVVLDQNDVTEKVQGFARSWMKF